MSTATPPTEAERLPSLAKFALLDTAPEPEFDRIAAHAARVFHAPIALVSLADARRQWFKSHHGTTLCETPRDQAFCAQTILENRPLIVPDATLDARFADDPLVTGEPLVRFYAGAALTTRDGANIGSLCVLDTSSKYRPIHSVSSRCYSTCDVGGRHFLAAFRDRTTQYDAGSPGSRNGP